MLDKKSKVHFKIILEAKRAEVFILRLSLHGGLFNHQTG